MKHFYTEPDISKRQVSNRFGGGEGERVPLRATYNPHLTIGELCLLRALIHDLSAVMQKEYSHEYFRVVLPVLHKWLFADGPDLPVWLDIKEHFENGVELISDSQ